MASEQYGETDLTSVPVCSDLDGTLLKTDTLHELVFALIKKNFFLLFFIPGWILAGKATLKRKLNQKATLNPELLPYDENVLNYLTKQKAAGRKLYLVTGCDRALAEKISKHLNIFDETIASDGHVNLTGENKQKYLQERFSDCGFEYIGDAKIDFKVWQSARYVSSVGNASFLTSVTKTYPTVTTFPRPSATIKTYLKAIRVHQWVKNFLIFVPLGLNYQHVGPKEIVLALAGFLTFSLLASATYIINDLLDLESDRAHHKKRYRAFAAADLSILTGIKLIVILSGLTLGALLVLPVEFAFVTLVYLATTLAYSFHIKTMVILDACVLAGLFTVRVIGGMAVIGSEWSFWLLAFSMFFFLSLAFTKRASELNALLVAGKSSAKGRGYIVSDTALVTSMGVAAGYIGVLVIALYINSEKVVANYATPYALWLICPLLLYWIGRIWLKTVRGEMNEDPIIFALKDRVSHITAIFCGLVVLSAIVAW